MAELYEGPNRTTFSLTHKHMHNVNQNFCYYHAVAEEEKITTEKFLRSAEI